MYWYEYQGRTTTSFGFCVWFAVVRYQEIAAATACGVQWCRSRCNYTYRVFLEIPGSYLKINREGTDFKKIVHSSWYGRSGWRCLLLYASWDSTEHWQHTLRIELVVISLFIYSNYNWGRESGKYCYHSPPLPLLFCSKQTSVKLFAFQNSQPKLSGVALQK